MQSLFLPQWHTFLRYHDLPGMNPTRVYLHGLGGAGSASFTHVVTQAGLAANRSILVDFLGCGFSDGPEDFSYTLEEHAWTIAALLDKLKLTGCALIGHSMGGSVAITLAAMRPDLVAHVVLAEANLDPGGGLVSTGIATQSEDAFCSTGYHTLVTDLRTQALDGDAIAAVLAGMFGVAAPYGLYRSAVSLVRGTQPTMREQLVTLRIPRAYIFGAHSLPDPDADALPSQGIPIFVVPEAGHGMLWDNPTGFASVLKEILTF